MSFAPGYSDIGTPRFPLRRVPTFLALTDSALVSYLADAVPISGRNFLAPLMARSVLDGNKRCFSLLDRFSAFPEALVFLLLDARANPFQGDPPLSTFLPAVAFLKPGKEMMEVFSFSLSCCNCELPFKSIEFPYPYPGG